MAHGREAPKLGDNNCENAVEWSTRHVDNNIGVLLGDC